MGRKQDFELMFIMWSLKGDRKEVYVYLGMLIRPRPLHIILLQKRFLLQPNMSFVIGKTPL